MRIQREHFDVRVNGMVTSERSFAMRRPWSGSQERSRHDERKPETSLLLSSRRHSQDIGCRSGTIQSQTSEIAGHVQSRDTLLGLKSSSFSDYSELQESVPGQCPGIYA